MSVHIIDHPLVQHKLSLMREKQTSTNKFRQLLQEISMLMGYEVTRDFPLMYEDIETPKQTISAPKIAGKKVSHTIAFEGVNILQHETPYAERFDFGTGELRVDKSGISLPNVFYRIDF